VRLRGDFRLRANRSFTDEDYGVTLAKSPTENRLRQ
jgi:hypothetical protein